MPSSTMKDAIADFFMTGWANRTPVVLPNRDYNPPASSNWIRFRVADHRTTQVTLGSNACYRTRGYVSIVVNVPENTGQRVSNILADEVINIFINKQVNAIVFQDIKKVDVGVYNGFFQTEVLIFFYGDEAVSSITA
jgi:hypothetical protein